jgi:hypothetical protein
VIYLQYTGLPHSDICGSIPICGSPQLFAAYHVFLRLWEPRHPPYALIYFFKRLFVSRLAAGWDISYVLARIKCTFYCTPITTYYYSFISMSMNSFVFLNPQSYSTTMAHLCKMLRGKQRDKLVDSPWSIVHSLSLLPFQYFLTLPFWFRLSYFLFFSNSSDLVSFLIFGPGGEYRSRTDDLLNANQAL